MSCPILCENYTKSNPAVTCPYCHFEACLRCVKTYVLSSATDVHCCQCKRSWSEEIIESMFSPSFIKNDLRQHTIKLLAEREKAFFPEALREIARIDANRRHKQAVDKMWQEFHKLQDSMNKQLKKGHLEPVNVDTINELIDETKKAKREVDVISDTTYQQDEDECVERVFKTIPCPAPNCHGMLNHWKCMACNVHVCRRCEEIRTENHECIPENVQSVQEKRKSTKPCPKCSVPVQKSEGCSQMWCTSCKTPFDWNTLKIINHGRIHNPYYFEWQKSHTNDVATVANDNPCVEGWPWQRVSEMLPFIPENSLFGFFSSVCRFMNEIWDTHIQHNGYQYNDSDYSELRIQRVLGRIDDKAWRARLSTLETRRIKNLRQHRIYMSLLTIVRDLIFAIRAEFNPQWSHEHQQVRISKLVDDLERVRLFTNEQLAACPEVPHRCGMISTYWHRTTSPLPKVLVQSEASASTGVNNVIIIIDDEN